MTSSEIRALRHAALVVLGLGFLRTAVEGFRNPSTAGVTALQDSSNLTTLLDESRGSLDEARRRALPLAEDERIDPNTAPEESLDRLPGVGAEVARRIVRMREEHGPFADPDDLLAVRGVGPATLAEILPHLEWAVRPRIGQAVGPRAGRAVQPPQFLPDAASPLSDAGLPLPGRLDLNRAGSAELQSLPGIGPVMAERILELRRDLRRFRTLEELESVRGIGPATIERIRPLVMVGG